MTGLKTHSMLFAKRIWRFYRCGDWLFLNALVLLGIVFGHRFYEDAPLSRLSSLLPLIPASCYLAHGFAFNRMCDRPFSGWKPAQIFYMLFPLAAGLVFAFYQSRVIAAAMFLCSILNFLYSFPHLNFKRTPWFSLPANMFMFGLLFFIGVSPQHAVPGAVLIMGGYLGAFFLPAQLVHELAHAREDGKEGYFKQQHKKYLALFLALVIILMALSVFVFFSLHLGWVFLAGGLAWIFLLYRFKKMGIWGNFDQAKALQLRAVFRYSGIGYGIFCFAAFLLNS